MEKTEIKEMLILATLFTTVFALDYAMPAFMATSSMEIPELSAGIRVLPEYKTIEAGKLVHYEIEFTNIANAERVDINIYVSAVNADTGQEKAFYQETIAVQTTLTAAKDMLIPSSAPQGRYRLQMEVNYRNQIARAADTFDVIKPAKKKDDAMAEPSQTTDAITAIILAASVTAAVIFAAIFLYERRRLKKAVHIFRCG